jgi:hypothetical protein
METCKTVWDSLHQIYILSEYSTEEWEKILECFSQMWNISLYIPKINILKPSDVKLLLEKGLKRFLCSQYASSSEK